MTEKLVKTGNNYILYSKDNSVLGITSGTMEGRKLSLKNCQSIENGYDLDEVVENIVKTIVPNDRGDDIWYGTSMAVGKLCFQKVLEILGDKKFDMNDIALAFREGIEHGLNPKKPNTTEYVQSLQTKEWDVEVEQELIQSSIQGGAIWKLKLDEDGCLILRKNII